MSFEMWQSVVSEEFSTSMFSINSSNMKLEAGSWYIFTNLTQHHMGVRCNSHNHGGNNLKSHIGNVVPTSHKIFIFQFFFHWLYSPLGTWPPIFRFHDHFTDGRTPWTSDQFVARPLPKHRTAQTQNKHTHFHYEDQIGDAVKEVILILLNKDYR
jgi:hypothetical protein